MKQKRLLLALVLLGTIGLGCGTPNFLVRAPTTTPVPVKTLRPTFTPIPSATSTTPPSPTPLPTDTPPPTDMPLPAETQWPTDTPLPADTSLPTEMPQPTNTPVLQTATPEPATPTTESPTNTPRPPTATAPRPTPTVMSQSSHVVGTHGVSGLVVARDKTTFSVGERAFFTYEAINHTQDPVGFELLGLKASNGLFNTSWVNPDVLEPQVPFKYDDGLTFDAPGTYQVMLAICFARCGEADADWEEFPRGAATITVK